MANFLGKNKTYNNYFLGNKIVGRYDLNLTFNCLEDIAKTLSNGLTSQGIYSVVVGASGSRLAENSFRYFATRLRTFGLVVQEAEASLPLGMFQWITGHSSKKSVGIFFGTNEYSDEVIQLEFFGSTGHPLEAKQLTSLLKAPAKVSVTEADIILSDYNKFPVKYEEYFDYLIKLGELKPVLTPEINIDLMFGPAEQVIYQCKHKGNWPIKMFNLQSQSPRILDYSAVPTGSSLKWYSTFTGIQSPQLFYAISGNGDAVGVYDLHQKEEVSYSSASMLLLYALRGNQTSAFIENSLSSRVIKLAKKLKYKVINKGKADLTITNNGRYAFTDGLVNPIQFINIISNLCRVENKSPGQIVDYLNKKYFKNIPLYRNRLYINPLYKTKEQLYEQITNTSIAKLVKAKASPSYKVFYLENDTQVTVSFLPFQSIEVDIESNSEKVAIDLNQLMRDI